MDDEALLELAARLARQAGQAIMAIRAAGFAVGRKTDRSPVTAADHAAEALIVEGLREAAPAIPVIAEEEVEAGIAPAPTKEYWLVDPLDGTRDFAAGRPHFAVNIGLVREGRPILGAVALPFTGEVFAGRIGAGAWKEDAAGRRRITVRPPPAEGLTVMASFHHGDDPRLARFLAAYPVREVIRIGSAEKVCRVAEGAADLYPRFGTTMEWDTAGPEAVLLAAGGRFTRLDGSPMPYGKPGFRNDGFIARGGA
jgi:3'(2'), 5'-bisphosphate nucleotidase